MLVGGVWTLLCALGGARSLTLVLVLVAALVLYMRCHQIGKCYRDKTVTVTVAATRYVAVVAVVACSCSCSCACISGKAVASAAEPLH